MDLKITVDSNYLVTKFTTGGVEYTLEFPIIKSEFLALVNQKKGVKVTNPDIDYFFFNRGGNSSTTPQLLTLENFIQLKDDFYEFKYDNQLQCEVSLLLKDLLEQFAKNSDFNMDHFFSEPSVIDKKKLKLVIWGGDSREKWRDRKIGKFEINWETLLNKQDTWIKLGEYQYETDSWFYSFWIKMSRTFNISVIKIKGYHYKTSDTDTTQNYENTFNAIKGVKLEVI